MTRRLTATLLVVGGCFALGADLARACGDKFLTFGPSPALNKFSSLHPSTILVVKRSKALAVNSSKLKDSLVNAGHKVKAIDSPTSLAKTLAEGKYDAVLVDPADAETVASYVRSSTSQPMLVRVLSDPTPPELAASEGSPYLKTPDTATNVLKRLDGHLAQRKASRRATR